MIPKVEIGKTGIQVPIFAIGTWQIRNSENMIRVIRASLELGVNHIDTAEMYSGAEEVISSALKGIPRESVFITSKVLPSNSSFSGTISACKRSLKRLKTDYIDLYLLHWFSGDHPLDETFSAFKKLQEDGLIRFAGVSNFELDELERFGDLLKKYQICNNQVEYNLSNYWYVEDKLLPLCERYSITVSGYSPFWVGRIPYGSKQWNTLELIAHKYGKTPFQLILNFLVRTKKIFVIFKTENLDHLRENIEAVNFVIEEEDKDIMKKLFSDKSGKNR